MTKTTHAEALSCAICGNEFHSTEVMPAGLLHDAFFQYIHTKYPSLTDRSYLCHDDLNRIRRQFVEESLQAEQGELTKLQQEVLKSIQENELIVRNINTEFDDKLSFGDRLADKVAEFGGSWKFIILFACVLACWITINSIALLRHPFDPFPFILLNLVLSCVAAIQAPVIMMSQNRQEAKDRLRAEQDFRTNLKAELEIRTLHAKIDELITHQWQRLLEIQQIQTDMMDELTSRVREQQEPAEEAAAETAQP